MINEESYKCFYIRNSILYLYRIQQNFFGIFYGKILEVLLYLSLYIYIKFILHYYFLNRIVNAYIKSAPSIIILPLTFYNLRAYIF